MYCSAFYQLNERRSSSDVNKLKICGIKLKDDCTITL